MFRKISPLYQSYMMLFLTSLGWASSTIVIKLFISDLKAYHLMFGRFLIAFLLVLIIQPKKMTKLKRDEIMIALVLGVLIFASYAFGIISLKYTTASKSGFFVAMSVLLVPISQLVVRRKSFTGLVSATVILSLIGMYFISGMDGLGFNLGDLLALGCATTYTIYILVVDKFVKEMDGVTLVLYQLLLVTVLSLISAACFEGLEVKVFQIAIVPIFFTGVFGTAMTLYFQNHAQKYASPESVGLLLLGEPVLTLVMAFYILNETITGSGILGGVCIISAMVITVIKKI